MESLQEEECKIKAVLADPKAMRITRGDWRAFRAAETCHVCDKPLEGDSVRDHFHITGKYRGAVHTACNLKLRLSPKTTTIPVDSHLLMQAISKVEGRVHCIPNNTEKYISFSLGQLRFIDSVQFLLVSLDRLVAANPPEAFWITAQHEPDRKRLELLLLKGMYPYEYMDSWDRFAEPKLPPKEAFYSKLSDAHISDEDYAHAQKVWKAFMCKTLVEIQRPVLPDRRVAFGRCLRDVPEDVPPPVWPGPGSLLYQPVPFVGRLAQEDRR